MLWIAKLPYASLYLLCVGAGKICPIEILWIAKLQYMWVCTCWGVGAGKICPIAVGPTLGGLETSVGLCSDAYYMIVGIKCYKKPYTGWAKGTWRKWKAKATGTWANCRETEERFGSLFLYLYFSSVVEGSNEIFYVKEHADFFIEFFVITAWFPTRHSGHVLLPRQRKRSWNYCFFVGVNTTENLATF